MITKDLQAVRVEGELEGRVIDMRISEAAEAHIQYQLANLYEDAPLACVREPSTNGFDALVQAAKPADRPAILAGTVARPIEVTLPSRLAPMLIIRDYGCGMNFDDIVTIYSQYGASTKRDSNDFNGALGFGCKAPLAYTPSFSVTSVKDGNRVTVSVGRKPSGAGKMTVAEGDPDSPCPTTEPNGTTVMIPIRAEDVDRFADTARDFFFYWKPGTVLVNGKQPESVSPDFKLTDDLAVVKDSDSHRIVMANVAYPVPDSALQGLHLNSAYKLLAYVPTGAVEMTPSREALKLTPDVRDYLNKLVERFNVEAKGAVQRKIDAATDKAGALAAMVQWRSVLPAKGQGDGYTFKGAILPTRWAEPKIPNEPWPFLTTDINPYYSSTVYDSVESVGASNFARDIFILGFQPTKFASTHLKRLKLWRADGRDDVVRAASKYILVRGDTIPAEVKQWIDPARIAKWEDIKRDYKLPRQVTAGGSAYGGWKQVAGSYEDVWTEKGPSPGETPARDIRQNKPIYWFRTKETHMRGCIALPTWLHKEFTVVQLQANRVGKFLRDFPAAKPLRDALEGAYKAWTATLTDDHYRALEMERHLRYSSTVLDELDPKRVDDPAIREAVRLRATDLTQTKNLDRVFRLVLHKGLPAKDVKWANPLKEYPLAPQRVLAGLATDHLYLYLNTAYAAKP